MSTLLLTNCRQLLTLRGGARGELDIPKILFSAAVCMMLAGPGLAQEEEGCRFGAPRQVRRINGFVVRVDRLTRGEVECRARVVARGGGTIFEDADWDIRIVPITGKDLNGDGKPEVVFEGYGGGAHCCWTYWIVSLGEPAGLLRTIYNQRSGRFQDLNKDGRIEFVTLDGNFDYFDDMSHAFSPFPSVILRFEGNKMRRVNDEFWPRYKREIAEAQKELSERSLSLFRADDREGMHMAAFDWLITKQRILEIVLAHLYAGRKDDAWSALREMWPPSDLRRIRYLITKTSREGFLGDTSDPRYGYLR